MSTPGCGQEMWDRRVAIMGAWERNEDVPDTPPAEPYEPWHSPVMVLAGLNGDQAWLWLACSLCGWFLGYSPQYDPQALADCARSHADTCPNKADAPWPHQDLAVEPAL